MNHDKPSCRVSLIISQQVHVLVHIFIVQLIIALIMVASSVFILKPQRIDIK